MRTKNSIRNSAFAFGGQLLSIVLSFVTRTVFIVTLGANYLGVNGLFSSILSLLSFAELGIGTAIIYALYKPFADEDTEKICALMNYYEKAYRIIGMVVALLGIALVPFLGYFIGDKPDVPNLTLIYFLYLFNSVASYFFVYKRSIILVSQNGHINTTNQSVFLLLQNAAQIMVLVFTQNFLLYLVMQIISSIVSNISISNKVDKMFPYLRRNKHVSLDIASRKSIGKNVVAMMSHKLGSVLVSGTDNLLISSFIGVVWVGLYSNYILILGTLTSLLIQLFNAVTASVGNLNALENNERSYSVFNTLFFISLWCFGFWAIALSMMLNPFIELWIGAKYLLDAPVVAIIIINFFVYGMRQTSIVYINTYGLFWNIKYKSIFEAVINLSAGLIFLARFHMGIYGVLLATTISTLCTNFWWEPWTVYKFGFNKRIGEYFKKYSAYVLVVLVNFAVTYWFCGLLKLTGVADLIYRGLVCFFITNGIFFLTFNRTREYQDLVLVVTIFMKKPLSDFYNFRQNIYNDPK